MLYINNPSVKITDFDSSLYTREPNFTVSLYDEL